MFVSDDGNGFTIWNDPRCARFSNSFIAGMILDAAKVEKCAGFMAVSYTHLTLPTIRLV